MTERDKNQLFWWCAGKQRFEPRDDWPDVCPFCDRKVRQGLSTHHDLLLWDDINWEEY